MSHTPGPWRVVQRRAAGAFTPKNGLTLRYLKVDTGSVVWTPSEVQTGGYTEEHLKQAHLIAAAPELLRLARDYRRVVGLHSGAFPDGRGDEIDAVLAKATGGAQ